MPAAEERVVVVPASAAGDRLDSFLQHCGEEPDRSRSEWQRLISGHAVLLNGSPSKPGRRVTASDRVTIASASRELGLPPEDAVDFEVVYEDAAMIVVNKPAGVVVHPAPGNERGTLVNGLLARFPELRSEADEFRPGIVHRLDKDTSGLMVVGRTLSAMANLQRQWRRSSVEKRYLLLVRGAFEEEEGFIDKPIGRDPRHRQRMAVRAEGRAAQTHFWVRERFARWTLLEAQLLTGRTHQLRVHFASIGHPVAGDVTYGRDAILPGLERQFLHAYLLRLRSPYDDTEHTFVADLPSELLAVLDRLRQH